jgi:hypothetical protein
MCNEASRIKQVIRGHLGAFESGNGEEFTDFSFLAERPQVTGNSAIKDETIKTDFDSEALKTANTTYLHFKNWVEAMQENKPERCNNTPDLGAAALITVILGACRDGRRARPAARSSPTPTSDSLAPGSTARIRPAEREAAQFASVLSGSSTTNGSGKSAARSPPRERSRLVLKPPFGWLSGISMPPRSAIRA